MQIYSLPLLLPVSPHSLLSCHSFNFSASMVPAAPLSEPPPLAPNSSLFFCLNYPTEQYCSHVSKHRKYQSFKTGTRFSENDFYWENFLVSTMSLGGTHRFSLASSLYSAYRPWPWVAIMNTTLLYKQGCRITNCQWPLVKGKWTGTRECNQVNECQSETLYPSLQVAFGISSRLNGIPRFHLIRKCEDVINFRRIKSKGRSKVFLRLLSRAQTLRSKQLCLRKWEDMTQRCFIPANLSEVELKAPGFSPLFS